MSSFLPAYAFADFHNRKILEPQGADNIIDLTIGKMPHKVDRKQGETGGINGTVPVKEEQNVEEDNWGQMDIIFSFDLSL